MKLTKYCVHDNQGHNPEDYDDTILNSEDAEWYSVDETKEVIKELLSTTPDLHELLCELSELFEVDI